MKQLEVRAHYKIQKIERQRTGEARVEVLKQLIKEELEQEHLEDIKKGEREVVEECLRQKFERPDAKRKEFLKQLIKGIVDQKMIEVNPQAMAQELSH